MRSIGRVDRFRLWKTSHEAVLSDTAAHLVLAWRGSCDPLQELVREWCVAPTQVEQEASLRKPEAWKQLIVTKSRSTTANGATIVTRPLGVASATTSFTN